jgi:chromosomal replication initiator protein
MYLDEYVVSPAEQYQRVKAARARLYSGPAKPRLLPTPPREVLSALAEIVKPLPPLEGAGPPKIRVATVIAQVADEFGVSAREICSDRRSRGGGNGQIDVITPRFVAMHLCREITSQSLPEIGRRMGGRDHTSVLNGIRKMRQRLKVEPDLAARVAAVRARIERGAI